MFRPTIKQREVKFDVEWFKGDAEQFAIAKQIAGAGGSFTRNELLEFLASNLDSGTVIKNMMAVGELKSDGGVAAFRARETRRSRRAATSTDKTEIDRIMKKLDELLIGQDHVKAWVRRTLEARPDNPQEALPNLLGMAGPPGVGKTELFRALATALYGDPDAVVIIRCAELKTEHDVNVLLGAAPGLVESNRTSEISQLSSKEIQEKFGDKGPKLVLFDEVDKIGDGKPEVIKSIMNALGSFIEDGFLRLKNGDTIDLRDSIMGFASNAGMDSDDGLSGDGARTHYTGAFRSMVPRHIVSRVADVVAFDPHDESTVSQVAGKLIEHEVASQLGKAAKERGVEANIDIDPALLSFVGACGFHPRSGARPVKNLVRNLVNPQIRKVASMVEDEERWTLKLADIGDQARRQIVEQFRAADGGVPDGINQETFPLDYDCTNPKPVFMPYAAEAQIPHDPSQPLIVLGSGAVGGRGFLMSKPTAEDPVSMHFLHAGATEDGDRFEVAPIPLPDALANANNDLRVTNLGPNKLLAVSTHAPEGANTADTNAFVYDSKTSAWEEIEPPPVPLVGAALVGHEGKALLFGGRVQDKTGDRWDVSNDPREMNGAPIENMAYIFRTETGEWDEIHGGPDDGVVGAATVAKDGKGYILGGEELYRPMHSGLIRSNASKNVWTFDFEAETFERGPSLKRPIAFGSAFTNANGNVQVLGGATYAHDGRDMVESRSVQRLVNGRWREEQMPTPGLCLSAVPEVPGSWVVGPFGRDNGSYGFDILRPDEI